MKKTLFPMLCLALTLVLSPLAQARSDRDNSDSVAGVFDYYLMALSWSPTFCLTRPDNAQCTGKGYGFVLHGLWPQNDKGRWPQFCAGAEPMTAQERAYGRTLFPTAQLLSHEWKKHGTCSGLGAGEYLRKADQALATLRIPANLEASTTRDMLTAPQIVDLFRQANPGLPEGAIAVRCNGPQLAQVWVCMTKDLAFRACDKGVRTQCRSGEVRVPAVR
jgi:ribonuclease T2